MGLFDPPMVTIECYKCSAPIVVTAQRHARLRQTGEDFWCPNGHEQCYTEPENAKLKKQVAQLEGKLADMTRYRDNAVQAQQDIRDQREQLRRRLYAAQGWITRLRRQLHPADEIKDI